MAEEVVQISFIRVWEKRECLSIAYPIEVQIARIARSVMIDVLRKRASERKALDAIKHKTELSVLPHPMDEKQLAERVNDAVQKLPSRCKRIFELSRVEGLTYLEIAGRLSISPKTVENQMSKALRAVRRAVALCYFLPL